MGRSPLAEQPPRVSVVIPCFNGARWLTEAIESVLAQTQSNIEIIVVDDGSTDESLAIAASFGDRVLLERQQRLGANAARNLGLRLANGTWVKFLDADDMLLPDCVEWQAQAASRLPTSQTAVFGYAIYVDEGGADLGYRAAAPEDGPVALEWVIGNLINTASPLYRRADVQEIGGFDETLTAGQEYDLNVRLAIAGLAFIYRNLPTYRFRQHDAPSRLSRQAAADVFPARIASTERHIRLAERRYGERLPLILRRAFAHHLWGLGRGALQGDVPGIAEECFAGARALCPEYPIPGSLRYRLLSRMLAPRHIERVSRAYHALADRR